MRLLVTGKTGQVVSALLERAPSHDVTVIPAGRPELDLENPASGLDALAQLAPDAIISAAAYTAVDKAETEPERAEAINALAPGVLAGFAAEHDIPIVHLSTDYVFDGQKASPYVEADQTNPLGVYGASKLRGEAAVMAATANYAILRTAWVYSPFGHNFLKSMLRVGAERFELRVVNDQRGNPTSALDIADAVIGVARNLVGNAAEDDLRGIFHMTAGGEASWADFAAEIFAVSAQNGGPAPHVARITTADYPTAARRPANSRLECSKLFSTHGLALPQWQTSTRSVVQRLLAEHAAR